MLERASVHFVHIYWIRGQTKYMNDFWFEVQLLCSLYPTVINEFLNNLNTVRET